MNNQKKGTLHLTSGIITLVLTVCALALFLLSFTTNYYTFGGMNSGLILTLILGAIGFCILSMALTKKHPDNFYLSFLPFAVIACLAAAAMLLLGDRVEGIGNCIVTDYDSGHGGEEAIYMSLASCFLMLIAMVYNIVGSFRRDHGTAVGKGKTIAMSVIAAALVIAIGIATIMLTGVLALGDRTVVSDGQGGYSGQLKGTYKVSFNQNNGNLDDLKDYQFLCSDFSGIAHYDNRLYCDMALTLDGAGAYKLFSEVYCIEAGKRCEIGDDTGLGQVITMNAEGTYVTGENGMVTTSTPSHAVFEMKMDTYSSQMKEAVGMNVGGNTEDGVYDSNDNPAVLDFVPETTWTLADGAIVKYGKPALSGTFTVSFNGNAGNVDLVQDYEFIPATTKGLLNADSRLFLDFTLTLDGAGGYELLSDSYCMEAGKRCVIGDETGLGLVLTTKAEGTYVDNGDGTVTTSPATHAVAEMATDTYSMQMKGPAKMAVGDHDEDGTYDSAEYPEVLELVPETIWTLSDGAIVSYYDPNAAAEEAEEEPAAEPTAEEAEPASEPEATGVMIPSDDEGTKMTFFPGGTYRFDFESYSIVDEGTYTFEDGVLTLTDVNGVQYTADGDPLHLHYGYSGAPDQLTGDYTIAADTFNLSAAEEAEAPADAEASAEPMSLTVVSDDRGTTISFCSDGTYRFWFEAYSIEDLGTWQIADGILSVTDANGVETQAEGTPYKLHYTYSKSDQLTGDYTIPVGIFPYQASGISIPSDDFGTGMTFFEDGTYLFTFDSYSILDQGTWSFEEGILTLTDVNSVPYTAEGDPLQLHYGYSGAPDQLTGDFTIAPSLFA